MLYVVRDEYR